MVPREYSFTNYLSAKKSVDDRALNRRVWGVLADQLPSSSPDKPLWVLEIGAGIGTMVERMIDWELLKSANYTAIDAQAYNVDYAHQYLYTWAHTHGFQSKETKPGLLIKGERIDINIQLESIELDDFIANHQGNHTWDLLVAHALFDLIDVSRTLKHLFELSKDGGLFYFSQNYDGLTILEPTIEMEFDQLILENYNHTMDNRLIDGKKSGDSRTGRHLFNHLTQAGAHVLAAGSSDWVVYPGPDGYPHDEEYFLHFIINTIYKALRFQPGLEIDRLEKWIEERHAQIERNELVYIAHQIDYVGSYNG